MTQVNNLILLILNEIPFIKETIKSNDYTDNRDWDLHEDRVSKYITWVEESLNTLDTVANNIWGRTFKPNPTWKDSINRLEGIKIKFEEEERLEELTIIYFQQDVYRYIDKLKEDIVQVATINIRNM